MKEYSSIRGKNMNEQDLINSILNQVHRAVVGKEQVVRRILLAVLARGHVLLEDIPGVGKTTMALAFSRALGLKYHRVQFTPDVMPSDLTGFSIFNQASRKMEYQPGALLCNLFLADELNRATSRTQSALLEAMEEGQVTVDGVTHPISQPFLVIATQNPTGAAGTQLLPDSQLDRFTLQLSIGYPTRQEEAVMVRNKQMGNPLEQVEQVTDCDGLEQLRKSAQQVYLSDEVLDYLLRLVEATRREPAIQQGASPRATLALVSASRANALFSGRDYVIPEDVSELFHDVIAHRLLYASQTGSMRQDHRETVKQILRSVKPPKLR